MKNHVIIGIITQPKQKSNIRTDRKNILTNGARNGIFISYVMYPDGYVSECLECTENAANGESGSF